MATQAESGTAPAAGVLARRPTLLKQSLFYLRHKPLGTFGMSIVLFAVLIAIFAGFIDRYHHDLDRDYELIRSAPTWDHWFGTDSLGRDVYSRTVHGARISMMVGFLAVFIGTGAGAIIGLISGYFMGKLDAIVQRVVDMLMSFPDLILALTIVTVFGQSLMNVILAISVTIFPRGVRVIRSSTLSIREMDYVLSARAVGARSPRIILQHIMPNTIAPFLIIMSSMFGTAILTEAGLSFLGLGPAELPSWGRLIGGAERTYFTQAPWLLVIPGAALTFTVLGFAFAGDALRDILDPKLRGR